MITSEISDLLNRVFMEIEGRWALSLPSDGRYPHRRIALHSLDKQTFPVVLIIFRPDEVILPDDTTIYVNGRSIGDVAELGREAQESACALYTRLRQKEGMKTDTTAETLQRILTSDL